MSAKRVKKTKINLWPIVASLVFATVIASAVYFLLLKPSNISCGIFLDKKENGNTIDVKLGCGEKTKWIKVSKRLGLPAGYAYDVSLKGINVSSIKVCKSYAGKVYSYDSAKRQLELERGYRTLSPDAVFYRVADKEQKLVSERSLIIGSSTSRFIEENGLITAVIVGKPDLEKVRVGLSTKLKKSQKHKDIILYSKRIITVKYGIRTIKVRDFALGIHYRNGYMEIDAYDEAPDKQGISFRASYGRTKERIHAYSDYDYAVPISFKSFDKGDSDNAVRGFPQYYGSLEFSIHDDAIRAVNEVDPDTYAANVVLSRMNNIGDYPTACSVQTVCARTLTLSELLSGRNSRLGYHISDTNASQPYNPGKLKLEKKPEEILAAIAATSGQVMTYNGGLIDTRSYMTSCGTGAPYNEVWYEGSLPGKNNPKPYLAFENFSNAKIENLSSEADASNFLKDWTIKSHDSNSKFFRWKYSLDMRTLNKLVNGNIHRLYMANKQDFKKKWHFNIYRQTAIPKEGIGTIKDIYVSKRGAAGNVLELTLISDTGEYRVTRAENYNRMLISKDIELDFIYGSSQNGFSTPPSSFFVIDRDVSGSSSKALDIYGGGSGHGVGMSQYGVIGMIRDGRSYKDILETYYKDVKLTDWKAAIDAAADATDADAAK